MNPEQIREHLAKLQAIKDGEPGWSPYIGPAISAGNTLADLLQWHSEHLEKNQPVTRDGK